MPAKRAMFSACSTAICLSWACSATLSPFFAVWFRRIEHLPDAARRLWRAGHVVILVAGAAVGRLIVLPISRGVAVLRILIIRRLMALLFLLLEQVVDALRTHSPEAVFKQHSFWKCQTCVDQDGLIA